MWSDFTNFLAIIVIFFFLGPWEPHGSSWYNCNRYDEDEAKNAREGQEKSRSALQRYLFYCNRYMNHLQSLKFENKLYTMVKVFLVLIFKIYFVYSCRLKFEKKVASEEKKILKGHWLCPIFPFLASWGGGLFFPQKTPLKYFLEKM